MHTNWNVPNQPQNCLMLVCLAVRDNFVLICLKDGMYLLSKWTNIIKKFKVDQISCLMIVSIYEALFMI